MFKLISHNGVYFKTIHSTMNTGYGTSAKSKITNPAGSKKTTYKSPQSVLNETIKVTDHPEPSRTSSIMPNPPS